MNGSVAGETRDISPSGVYIVMDHEVAVGKTIHFALDMDSPTGPLCLTCRGRVVRIEDRNERHGIAVELIESRLERRSAHATKPEPRPGAEVIR